MRTCSDARRRSQGKSHEREERKHSRTFGKGVGNACWNMNGRLIMPIEMWDEDAVWFGLVFLQRSDQTFYALPVS